MIGQLLKGKDSRILYETKIDSLTKDDLKKHQKSIIEGALAKYEEDLHYGMDEEAIVDIMGDMLPGDLQVYYSDDHRANLIVKNVKGKGWPDMDEVIEKAAKKASVSEESIRAYIDDQFLSSGFWDTVESDIDALKTKYKGFTSAGRSGGYWGVPITDILEINDKKFKKAFAEYLKKEADAIIEDLGGEDYNPEDLGLDLADDAISEEGIDYGNIVQLNKKKEQELKEMEKSIDDVIKDSEKSDRWVDDIISNQWWKE